MPDVGAYKLWLRPNENKPFFGYLDGDRKRIFSYHGFEYLAEFDRWHDLPAVPEQDADQAAVGSGEGEKI